MGQNRRSELFLMGCAYLPSPVLNERCNKIEIFLNQTGIRVAIEILFLRKF